MSAVINDGYTNGNLSSRERTSYQYNSGSYRVHLITETGTTLSPNAASETWALKSEISFLADSHNHTGYTQTIRETKVENGHTLITDYTFGNDEILQRVHGTKADGTTVDETLIFGHDGHGSVRYLTDLAGVINQVATYAAYGAVIAVHNAIAQLIGTSESAFKSTQQYSGEQWDASLRMQNLRARPYDPSTGRFVGKNPFQGNMQDPQSLHKYAYVHGDPIQGIDSTGMFFTYFYLQAKNAARAAGAYAGVVAQFGVRAAGSAFNVMKKLAIESLKPTTYNLFFGIGPIANRVSSTVVTFLGRFLLNSTINLLTLNVLQENFLPVIGSFKMLAQQANNYNGRLAGLPGFLIASYSSQIAEGIQDMLSNRDEKLFTSAATTGQIGVLGSSILAAIAYNNFTTGIGSKIAIIEEFVPLAYSKLPPTAQAKVKARLGIQDGIRDFEIDYSNPSIIWNAYNGHLRPHEEIDIFRKLLVSVDQSNDRDAEESLVLLISRMQQKYGMIKINGVQL
jgi:RHS repeat-associated protein